VILRALKAFNSKMAFLLYRDIYPWLQKHRKEMESQGYTIDDPSYRVVLMAEEKVFEKSSKFSDL